MFALLAVIGFAAMAWAFMRPVPQTPPLIADHPMVARPGRHKAHS